MADNTLLGRCTVAYEEALSSGGSSAYYRDGIRAVIEHLAAELVALDQSRSDPLSAHEVARWLLEEAGR